MATKTNGIKFDAFENTITMSLAFAKKAQKYGSPEYKTLVNIQKDHPGAKIIQEEKRAATKKLTIKEMKAYISMLNNKEDLLAQFDAVQKVATICCAMPYVEIAKWFEENCQVPRKENGTLDAAKILVTIATQEKNADDQQAATEAKGTLVALPNAQEETDNMDIGA